MKEARKSVLLVQIVLIAAGLILMIGVKTVFSACTGLTDDGSYMSCHWAEQAVFAMAVAMTAISVIGLFLKDAKAKLGSAVSLIPAAVMTILIPNILISLCVMPDMHCNKVMRPADILFSIIIIVFALISAFMNRKEDR